MVGFPSIRHYVQRADGLAEQVITIKTPEEEKFWNEVFPPDKPPEVNWQSEMTILLGAIRHPVTFQRVEERDQFRRTFSTGCRPTVRRSANTITLSCEPIQGTPAPTAPAPTDLTALTDAQLRTRAAELDVPADAKTPRAVLIELIKTAEAMAAAV